MVTRQGYGLGTGGCKGLCPAANRALLGYTFSLSVSIKDRSLHKASWASHRFIVPSAYLGMGAGKTCCSLITDLALSGPTDWGGDGRDPCTTLSPELRSGAWSPNLDGDLDTRDRRVMGWSCLCLGYKRGVCFWGTQLGHRFANRQAIRYGLSTV